MIKPPPSGGESTRSCQKEGNMLKIIEETIRHFDKEGFHAPF